MSYRGHLPSQADDLLVCQCVSELRSEKQCWTAGTFDFIICVFYTDLSLDIPYEVRDLAIERIQRQERVQIVQQ